MQSPETVIVTACDMTGFLFSCMRFLCIVVFVSQFAVFVYLMYERFVRLRGYVPARGYVTSQKFCRGAGYRDYIDYRVEGITYTVLDGEFTSKRAFVDSDYNPVVYRKDILYNRRDPSIVFVDNYVSVSVRHLMYGITAVIILFIL